jgi:hypothetical protein
MEFMGLSGQIPNARDPKTSMEMELLDASGKKTNTWETKYYIPSTYFTREPKYNLDKLAGGTYTVKVILRLWDGSKNLAAWSWKYIFKHIAPLANVYLNYVKAINNSDGTYANKISIGHSGCMGKAINMEIYDEWDGLVFRTKSSKPMSSSEGAYYFKWNGYPSGAGLRCDSGKYTIKYWSDGRNPQQSDVWLDVY